MRLEVTLALAFVVSCAQGGDLGSTTAPDPSARAREGAGGEMPFMSECKAAMTKMMSAMDVQPSGDVDRDFVAMMAPHHQGAIDMAVAELRYGRNEQLRRLAQEIIVTQQDEIRAMNLAIGEPLHSSGSSPMTPNAK